MGSYLTKKSLMIGARTYEFSIEAHFWICFEEIAQAHGTTAEHLARSIVEGQAGGHLPSAIRTYVLTYFQRRSRLLENPDRIRSRSVPVATPGIWPGRAPARWLH